MPRFMTKYDIYRTCRPVECPTTPAFDLRKLLRASTAVEDEVLPSQIQDNTQPLHKVEDSVSQTYPTAVNTSSSNVSGRPPGYDYQHWRRKQLADAAYLEHGHVPRAKTLKTLVPLALETALPTNINTLTGLQATTGAYEAYVPRPKKRKLQHPSPSIENPPNFVNPVKIPPTSNVYRDLIDDPHLKNKTFALKDLAALRITVLEWNGRDPVPLVDAEGRIFAVLAGRPTKNDFMEACHALYAVLESEGKCAAFTSEQLSHRRGDYPALNVGLTHGMGTLRPTFLETNPHSEMVERLLQNPDLQRLAAYQSSVFALWAPETYKYYKTRLDRLFEHTGLRRIFHRLVFPTAALNFGPNVCTRKHQDVKNCPFGWCGVTPLGRFNHKTGGHLILWELGLAVEFPAGSTILIPSATISHSNTTIKEGVRASFTQYCSGGLFRWVDYGFRTEQALKKSPTEYREILQLRPERWRLGVDLWSKIQDLRRLTGA